MTAVRSLDEADALVVATRRLLASLLDDIEARPDGGAHVFAHQVLLEVTQGVREALSRAVEADRARRGDVLQFLVLLTDELHAIAPIATERLLDPDPAVRLAAAKLIRALTTPPAIARSIRRAASSHPDPEVRTILA